MNQRQEPVLKVENLRTHLKTEDGVVKAVNGVTFRLLRGEVLGIVGESGCGKSITALSILRVLPEPQGKIVDGTIKYHPYERDGVIDITALRSSSREMRSIRGGEIGMIFQDPMTSLNPVFRIGDQIVEMIREHSDVGPREAKELAVEQLRQVQMPAPSKYLDNYPHELSGGMRQRAMIAMALSCNPAILIADEPTTALDVTVEAEIMALMQDLQDKLSMSVMLITHDLGVIAEMADRVLVMYVGWVVEEARINDLLLYPKHPYTQGLLKSIPRIGQKERLGVIEGTLPNPYSLPPGCYFASRCSKVMEICRRREPGTYWVSESHAVKCWLYSDSDGEQDEPGR